MSATSRQAVTLAAAWWCAWALLTAWPLSRGCQGAVQRGENPAPDEAPPGAVAFFPVVGLMLGTAQAGAWWAACRLFAAPLAAAFVVGVGLVSTRALHWDGWLDACDALFGGHDVPSRLAILRDSHVGAFAVVGGVWAMLVQWAALWIGPHPAEALVLAGVWSRWAMSMAVVSFPAARPAGLGAWIRTSARPVHLLAATAVAGAVATAVAGLPGLGTGVVAGVVGIGFATWARRLLGGLTGDVYGAVQVLAETAVLAAWAAGPGRV